MTDDRLKKRVAAYFELAGDKTGVVSIHSLRSGARRTRGPGCSYMKWTEADLLNVLAPLA